MIYQIAFNYIREGDIIASVDIMALLNISAIRWQILVIII